MWDDIGGSVMLYDLMDNEYLSFCLPPPPPNQDCGGGGKKGGLSSLSLHNFVPFGLQIKGPCKWCLEDVHC